MASSTRSRSTRSRSNRSRHFTPLCLALLAILGLLVSACGDDNDSSRPATTSKPRRSTTTVAGSGGSAPTETTRTTQAAKLPFDEGVAQLRSKVADTKGDLCDLLKV